MQYLSQLTEALLFQINFEISRFNYWSWQRIGHRNNITWEFHSGEVAIDADSWNYREVQKYEIDLEPEN